MKKILLLLFISSNLFGCNNQNGNKYVTIKGTKLSIIPPKGFSESDEIIGLEKDEESIIQVMDLVGGNFESNTATLTISEFQKKGISVLEFKNLKIDGFKAKYANIKGADDDERAILVFGDSTFSATLIAIFPSTSKNELLEDIKNSFFNVKYDKTLKIDPFANSNFIVEKNNSKFKFAKASANMFIFSENGNIKESYNSEPIVMISTYPFDREMSKEKLIEDMQSGLIEQGYIKKTIKNMSDKSINGYDSLEVEFYGEHNSKYMLTFMTVLVEGNKVLVFYGNAESDFIGNIREFKKLTSTLKIK